jgi:hypothetical protein
MMHLFFKIIVEKKWTTIFLRLKTKQFIIRGFTINANTADENLNAKNAEAPQFVNTADENLNAKTVVVPRFVNTTR